MDKNKSEPEVKNIEMFLLENRKCFRLFERMKSADLGTLESSI